MIITRTDVLKVTSSPNSTLADLELVFNEAMHLSIPCNTAEQMPILRVIQHPSSNSDLFAESIRQLPFTTAVIIAMHCSDDTAYRNEIYSQALTGNVACQYSTAYGIFPIEGEVKFMSEEFREWCDKNNALGIDVRIYEIPTELFSSMLGWRYDLVY
jgi:hypothetical protein